MVALPETISRTVEAIEEAVTRESERWEGQRVPLSAIGRCARHLWYQFRWAHWPETFSARTLRIFETGNIEEDRMVAWLRQAGITVDDQQATVTCAEGHARGKLDGVALGVPESPTKPHVLECKTHNTKSYAQLVKHGVEVSKPDHVAQMQVYMHLKGLSRALYLAKNKDTDELWSDRIKVDKRQGELLVEKAERVAFSQEALPKEGGPDSFTCRGCASHAICHEAQWARRNCRTCLHSTPRAAGWFCEKHDHILSKEAQALGCASHRYLPSLVPGEQIDVDEDEAISYRLSSGHVWIDEGMADPNLGASA